jgi:hypothetical protein
MVMGALCSPLGPHPEGDPPTDLYNGSTLIDIIDESNRRVNFNLLSKSVISLPAAIGTSGSPLGPRPDRDLATDLHSSSTVTPRVSNTYDYVNHMFERP